MDGGDGEGIGRGAVGEVQGRIGLVGEAGLGVSRIGGVGVGSRWGLDVRVEGRRDSYGLLAASDNGGDTDGVCIGLHRIWLRKHKARSRRGRVDKMNMAPAVKNVNLRSRSDPRKNPTLSIETFVIADIFHLPVLCALYCASKTRN